MDRDFGLIETRLARWRSLLFFCFREMRNEESVNGRDARATGEILKTQPEPFPPIWSHLLLISIPSSFSVAPPIRGSRVTRESIDLVFATALICGLVRTA